MTRRSLERWQREDPRAERRPVGRPRTAPAARRAALWQVARAYHALKRMGGWREVAWVLGRTVSTRLVQEWLSRLQKRRRRRARQRRRAARVHVEVRARDVLWSQDGTHLTRVKGMKVEAQVVRDVATCRNVGICVGAPAKGQDVVAQLERGARERGGWPLVWATDNGSAYTCEAVRRCLERHHVLHLRSAPHTPSDNAWSESGIRELKHRCGISGKARSRKRDNEVRDGAQAIAYWKARLADARNSLDRLTRRESRGGWTAEELDGALHRADHLVRRARVYKRARQAMAKATVRCASVRARRRAEREAIFATLESFELITRTRGNPLFHAGRCEAIS